MSYAENAGITAVLAEAAHRLYAASRRESIAAQKESNDSVRLHYWNAQTAYCRAAEKVCGLLSEIRSEGGAL